jgi:uncharacterized membrane protein
VSASSLLLVLHVGTGTVALIAGAAALAFRKGGRLHRAAGNLFFVSMLVMAGSGAIVAYLNSVLLSFSGGALTCYLVATAWATVMRRPGTVGAFEVAAMLFAVWVGALTIAGGIEAASGNGFKDGFPAGLYFFFGSVTLTAAAFDVRMLRRGGVSGATRLSRHLGRMGGALLIAASAFFQGQAHLFPRAIQDSNLLTLPVLAVIVVTLGWLLRVRLRPVGRPVGSQPEPVRDVGRSRVTSRQDPHGGSEVRHPVASDRQSLASKPSAKMVGSATTTRSTWPAPLMSTKDTAGP